MFAVYGNHRRFLTIMDTYLFHIYLIFRRIKDVPSDEELRDAFAGNKRNGIYINNLFFYTCFPVLVGNNVINASLIFVSIHKSMNDLKSKSFYMSLLFFSVFDKDRNGYVSAKEIKKVNHNNMKIACKCGPCYVCVLIV